MNLEENSYQQDSKQWQDKCNRLLYYHVVLTLKDGNTVDGIIGRVDDDQVIVLVGENVIEDESRFGRPLGVEEEDSDALDQEDFLLLA